jgi:LPXTG-motif cell wall-anchored protein
VNCQLPVTGANISMLVTLGLLLVATGIVSLLIVRRRGVGRGAAIVIALAVGTTALTFSEAPRADANSCPPTAPAVALAPAATTTTTAPVTTTSTTTTVPPTTTTTTTAPVPDLTPSITGPTTLLPGVRGSYTFQIDNVGSAPTSGTMTFTLSFTIDSGVSTISAAPLASSDWTFVGSSGGDLMYQSDLSFTIAAGAVSTGTFGVTWQDLATSGSFTIATTLPTGIGGETNAANNTASLTVVVPPLPG